MNLTRRLQLRRPPPISADDSMEALGSTSRVGHLGEGICNNKFVGDQIVVALANYFSVDLVAGKLRWGRHWGGS
jgi:hypothetical protein